MQNPLEGKGVGKTWFLPRKQGRPKCRLLSHAFVLLGS